MQVKHKLIDKQGLALAASILIFSWSLFWDYTSDSVFSFLAAVLAAAMTWLAYIVIKIILLAILEK